MGADTSIVKNEPERNPNNTGTEKKTGKHQDMEKRRRKVHWTPTRAVCSGIKDRQIDHR